MSITAISQEQIVEALHRIPVERWTEILAFMNTLREPGSAESSADKPIRTLGDILGSGLVGLWADRTDLGESREFAQQLRQQASHRALVGKSDAAGH